MFEDSPIATKKRYGQTKADGLVENLLGPQSIEMVLQEMGAIFKIWPPDFAQKNIYHILNFSSTVNELISLVEIPIFEKTCFVSKIAYDFFFFNITFDPKNQNTIITLFWKAWKAHFVKNEKNTNSNFWDRIQIG
jgi:hypothetical protein